MGSTGRARERHRSCKYLFFRTLTSSHTVQERWYPLQNSTRGEVRLGVIAHYDTFPQANQFSNPSYGINSSFNVTPLSFSQPNPSVPLSNPIAPPPVHPQSVSSPPMLQPISPSLLPQLPSNLQPFSPQTFSPPSQSPQPVQIPPINQPVVPQSSSPKPTRQALINFRPEDIQREFPHIAKGSFGVVFKGHAKGFSEVVVIKDLEIQSSKSVDEWRKEISLMR